jgi:hypothetical protein
VVEETRTRPAARPYKTAFSGRYVMGCSVPEAAHTGALPCVLLLSEMKVVQANGPTI